MHKKVNSEEIDCTLLQSYFWQYVKDRKLYLLGEAELGSNTNTLKQKDACIRGEREGCKETHLYFNSNY